LKFVTYRSDDGRLRPGVLEGDLIRAIATPTLREYVELAPHERVAWHTADELVALQSVTLDAPVRPSRNVFCVGRNYLEHAKEGARAAGRELKLPSVPTFFTKAPTAIAAPGAALCLEARVSQEYDFEAELAVVIGAECKDVPEDEALHVVFGYTALNDVTARDLQREHGQWFKGKSLDSTCPIGPWIVTPDEVGNPQALAITFHRNGVEKQNSNTREMIFPVARVIAELSKGMTLLPGDVIATGTPQGVGFARNPPEFLADGDVLDVWIEKIGHLKNTVTIA
jgi:2-keto-4-pentenoate hydratase/2-oxohepta-3-ene-1,7-dioic acid hydratase in catechol pathway